MDLTNIEDKVNMFKFGDDDRNRQVMQSMQDLFCRSNHIYGVCYGLTYNKITEFSGTADEEAYLRRHISVEMEKTLIASFRDDDLEDVISGDSNQPFILYKAVAIRGHSGKLLGVWMISGIAADLKSDVDNVPSNMRFTTLADFENAVHFVELLTKVYFQEKFHSFLLEDRLEETQTAQSKLKQMLHRNEVTTEVLKLLESDGDFNQIAENVLTLAGEYLGLSHCNLLRLNADGQTVDLLCEWCGDNYTSMIRQYSKLQSTSIPYFTGRPYTISSDSLMPEEFTDFFRDFNISAGVFLPLTVNDELSMYLGFIESRRPRKWAVEDVRFLNDVKRVLQTILLKRITKNSLASSYAAIDAILENSGCGICVSDASHGSVLYSNDTFNNMLVELSDRMNFESKVLGDVVEEGDATEYYAEAAGRWYSVTRALIRWVDGREVQMCTLYDISPMKEYQKKIEEQANLDDLTGLYNRHRFRKDFQDSIRDAVRSGGDQGSFLCINLDDFKDINDGLGHKNGDTLLTLVARSLKTICRDQANVYRLGGDEFAILVPFYNESEVTRITETIQKRFEQPWAIGDKDYYCTMCMGVVSYPKDGVSEDTLMQRADYALFEAKKKGKNQVETYNAATNTHSQRRLDLERCMREAVAAGCKEFKVYYQPLVDVTKKGHQCCGAEALVRWDSKDLGMVMPGEFITLAEYLGLINSIGEHVLVEACKRCKFWNDFGHPEYKVNVNLSVVQLQQKTIVDTVRNALIYTGIYPGNLTLEVTEGIAAGDMENMIHTMNELKALGVRLALDDFGTGYSSLSYLRELPLDVIKIDKCFVNEVGEDAFSDAFVKTVAELADTLHVNVIVEGVEDQAQESALEDMKVHMIQGYLYDQPLTQDEFESKYLD